MQVIPPDSFYGFLPRDIRSRIRRRVTLATGPNTTIFDQRNRASEIDDLAAMYGVDRGVIGRVLMPLDDAKDVWSRQLVRTAA
jgi:hypothetical protein